MDQKSIIINTLMLLYKKVYYTLGKVIDIDKSSCDWLTLWILNTQIVHD